MDNNNTEMAWVKDHLNINHHELDRPTALWWLKMIESDFEKFSRLAIFGFALKLGESGCRAIPPDLIAAYLKEFQCKVYLAIAKDTRVPCMPLFAVSGIGLAGNNLSVNGQSYTLRPGGEA